MYNISKLKLNQSFILSFNLLIIFFIYLIILFGGIVRSTSSGMGCPDWPKCFNQWIPPVKEDKLPKNYQKIFYEKRIEKNKKIFFFLKSFGFSFLLKKICNEYSIKSESKFNIFKTWTE